MKNLGLIFVSILIISGCNDKDLSPVISISENKITAQYDYGFGRIIEANSKHIFIASDKFVYIFKNRPTNPRHIQTITFTSFNRSYVSVHDIYVDEEQLIIGLSSGDGVGSVVVFAPDSDRYLKKQTITIGREEDRFGSSIDVAGDVMVVGADAAYSDCWSCGNEDAGCIYTYKKIDDEWVLQNEFYSVYSKPGDGFGNTVATNGNFIMAGPTRHHYRNPASWTLDDASQEYLTIYAREGNRIICQVGDEDVAFYRWSPNNNLFNRKDFYSGDIIFRGFSEAIELYDDYALLVPDLHYIAPVCHLLVENASDWSLQESFYPDEGEECAIAGIEITASHVIFGGQDQASIEGVYNVYFREYQH